MKKIKVIPRKSGTLCSKCKYGQYNSKCKAECETCKMNGASCACENIECGEPCKYFEREEKSNEKG